MVNMAMMVGWSPEAIIAAWEAHKASGRHSPNCPWLYPTYGDCTCGEHARRDEVHKASAVPEEVKGLVEYLRDDSDHCDKPGCQICTNFSRAADLLERAYISAVPEEIAEVVKALRKPTMHGYPQTMWDAADLLEGMAGQLERQGRLVDWYQAEHLEQRREIELLEGYARPPSSSEA